VYEMCTGREVSALLPSLQEYDLVEDDECRSFLYYIFRRREDGTFKSTIKKVCASGCVRVGVCKWVCASGCVQVGV
jgi:hypothetical protein